MFKEYIMTVCAMTQICMYMCSSSSTNNINCLHVYISNDHHMVSEYYALVRNMIIENNWLFGVSQDTTKRKLYTSNRKWSAWK